MQDILAKVDLTGAEACAPSCCAESTQALHAAAAYSYLTTVLITYAACCQQSDGILCVLNTADLLHAMVVMNTK